MDGILNLNKPTGITSAKALYRVRKITGVRKSGHAGTLDPGADGVLLLCLGKATKLTEAIMDQPKVYRATARLDVTSSSYDSDRPLEPVPVEHPPDADAVAAAARKFEGDIQQIPPAVSALKVGGRAAYKRERAGEIFEIKPRAARIYWLCVHQYEWPQVSFEMCCGRGTYVRAVIRDWGAALGAGGCLTSLTRTRVGPFTLEDAWSLEKLAESADAGAALCPLEQARAQLDRRPIEVPSRPV